MIIFRERGQNVERGVSRDVLPDRPMQGRRREGSHQIRDEPLWVSRIRLFEEKQSGKDICSMAK